MQPTFSGGSFYDAFMTKLNPQGSAFVYSTYLGGTDNDFATSIKVDRFGRVYITGATNSFDFPTTSGSYQTVKKDFYNVFVAKLNSSGSALIYSTYIGGNISGGGGATGRGIAIDLQGNAYITGETGTPEFPTTPGCFQPAIGGSIDGFVTKLNSTGSGLIYSTFLGGSDLDAPSSIAVGADGSAYVTGYTWSNNFPTKDSLQGTSLNSSDLFLTKLDPTGSSLVYSTYLGGSDAEEMSHNTLAVDAFGNAYITGRTKSVDFPITPGAYQTLPGGLFDAFIAKIAEQPFPVQLLGVVSRKKHGSGREFDIDLPLAGNFAIECRSGGAGGNYTLIFSFANTLTTVASASVTGGTGSVSSSNIDSNDAHNYIVNLTSVSNAQVVSVSLANVKDSAGNFSSAVSASMGVLLGDTSADGVVNSADITQTRRQSGNVTDLPNFREDVTLDGVINSADITLVRRQSGTALP